MLVEYLSTLTGKKLVFLWLDLSHERIGKSEVLYKADIYMDKRLATNTERKLSRRLGVGFSELSLGISRMDVIYVWTRLI
jgi:hypothetical protein